MVIKFIKCPNCNTDISSVIGWDDDGVLLKETVFLRATNAIIDGIENKDYWQCPACNHIWKKTETDEVNLNEKEEEYIPPDTSGYIKP